MRELNSPLHNLTMICSLDRLVTNVREKVIYHYELYTAAVLGKTREWANKDAFSTCWFIWMYNIRNFG